MLHLKKWKKENTGTCNVFPMTCYFDDCQYSKEMGQVILIFKSFKCRPTFLSALFFFSFLPSLNRILQRLSHFLTRKQSSAYQKKTLMRCCLRNTRGLPPQPPRCQQPLQQRVWRTRLSPHQHLKTGSATEVRLPSLMLT